MAAPSPVYYTSGDVDPASMVFRNPSSVRAAVNAAAEGMMDLTPEQRDMDAKLAAQGLAITNYKYPTCPVGADSWIKVESSWPECEAKLNMRWRTPEGWCYPENMCGLRDMDPDRKKMTQVRKVELLQRITGFLNTVRQSQRDEWLLKRYAELRTDKVFGARTIRCNDGSEDCSWVIKDKSGYDALSATQRVAFEDAVKAEMPADLRDLPTAAVIKEQSDMSKTLKKEAKAKTDVKTKKAHLKALKEAMLDAGMEPPLGTDMDEYAEAYLDDAIRCADDSIGKSYSAAKSACAADDKCNFYDVGDEEDAFCAPKVMADRVDKWETSAEVDPIGVFYRNMMESRARERDEKAARMAKAMGGSLASGAKRRVF